MPESILEIPHSEQPALLIPPDLMELSAVVRRFAAERLAPFSASWDKSGKYPRQAIREMGEMGLFGLMLPEEYGGSDVGQLGYAMAVEEVAAGDAACSTIMSVHSSVGCAPILKFGTQEQKKRFLPKMATGEWIGGFALTESHAGSDAANIKTRAVREGSNYVLNGSKQFITSGKFGKIIITFAVTDPSAGKKGITAFIVPTDLPGYAVARVEDKLGLRASDTCSLAFEDLRIPGSLRLGEEGEGYMIALANLEGGRIGIASQAVGIARAAFEEARNYARDRVAFGKPLIQHQDVAFTLANMKTQITAARQMVYHAASLKQSGRQCLTEASMAKLFASEMVEKVCSDALQIHGGYGFISDSRVSQLYRDARVCQIYEGASAVQRLLIARDLD